jgi:uncharacterized protein
MRRLGLAVLALGAATAAVAEDADRSLYTVTVLVTGKGEETRRPALGRALAGVLVKVSGDPALADEPAVMALGSRADTYLEALSYRDLMEGIPVHDEQGSRDRPFALTVTFDPERIDTALATLGTRTWPAPRPALMALVAVTNGDTHFVLARDGARGRDMREAIETAAGQYGLPVTLPDEAALASFGLGPDAPHDTAAIATLSAANGTEAAVIGTLDWSDAALGWTADWTMATGAETYHGTVAPVSFDDAFRSAIGGASQILSGHRTQP